MDFLSAVLCVEKEYTSVLVMSYFSDRAQPAAIYHPPDTGKCYPGRQPNLVPCNMPVTYACNVLTDAACAIAPEGL